MIYLCEDCKTISDKKPTHRLTCRDRPIIHEFEYLFQLVDFYENKIRELEHNLSHARCIERQVRGWYQRDLEKLSSELQ